MSSQRTIRARDLINDIQSGMTEARLMDKYDLSSRDLNGVKRQLHDLKIRRTKHIIRSIRSGASPRSIMEEYRIKSPGLRRILRTLLDAGAVTKAELDQYAHKCRARTAVKGVRRSPRKQIDYPLWIYDGGNPSKRGRVLDFSEKGVRIQGIETSIAEEKTFIVRFGASSRKRSFVFDAKCRWVIRGEQDPSNWVSGFEITNISRPDSRVLRSLIGT